MRMLFIAASAAVLVTSVSAEAKTDEKQSFTHKGVTYTYTVRNDGAAQVIQGRSSPDSQRFKLTLDNGKVYGQFGGNRVAFKAEEAIGATNTGGASLVALLGK